ncbi:MAG: MBL fold metallo-hydrolase [Acidimicrobiia bacterium]
MEVARGLYRQTLGIANWYLVEQGGAFVVVDAGTASDWSLLVEALRALEHRVRDVEAVLLTHAHPDHVGFAERARAEAEARIFIHNADQERLRGGKAPANEARLGRYLLRWETWRTSLGLLRQGGVKIVPVAEVSTFADGETLDVPGRPRAIHLPGHTDGSAGLWFEDRSALCTGDALVTHNPLTGRDGPQVMPAALNQDSDLALRSLDAVASISASVLLPGHGEPWSGDASEAVRQARIAGPS